MSILPRPVGKDHDDADAPGEADRAGPQVPPDREAEPEPEIEPELEFEPESEFEPELEFEPEPERRHQPAALGRRFGVPLSIYAATLVVQLYLINWLLPPGSTVQDRLLLWDGQWFVRIAQNGYPTTYVHTDTQVTAGAELAFFPGYPMLIRLVHALSPLDYPTAGILAAWIAAAAAAVLVHELCLALWDGRVAAIMTALVLTQPMSAALTAAYSESLFIALTAASLLAAYRHRWLLAGVLGCAAGLTRATGVALALALGVAALIHVANRDHGPRRWLALAGAALAALGVPGYVWWVGWRVGDPDAWFTIQDVGWGTKFDYGRDMVRFVVDTLRRGEGWIQVSVAFMLIAAVLATVLALRSRVWPPFVVYGLVALATVLGRPGWFHVKPRLLGPVLLALVPVALALTRARSRTAVAVLVGFGLFGLWYGAYMITVWRYAI
jgi:hypothetical protein